MEKENPVKVGEQITLAMKQETIDIIAKAEYIIKPGDGVSMIARDFNLSSSDILKYNQLEKSSTICIGKKLILPFPYKIASLEKKRKIRLAKEKKEAKSPEDSEELVRKNCVSQLRHTVLIEDKRIVHHFWQPGTTVYVRV